MVGVSPNYIAKSHNTSLDISIHGNVDVSNGYTMFYPLYYKSSFSSEVLNMFESIKRHDLLGTMHFEVTIKKIIFINTNNSIIKIGLLMGP